MFKKLLCAAAAAVMMTGTAQAIAPVDSSLAKVVVLDSGKTLRFVCAETVSGTKGVDWFSVAEAESIDPSSRNVPWCGSPSLVTRVVIDSSFSSYLPKSCAGWFQSLENLTTIVGLANLNTWEVKSFRRMFRNCSSLKTLNLSSFDTGNATDMREMFSGCSKLRAIYATSEFVTDNVTSATGIFKDCTSLVGEYGTTFDPSTADNKSYAFIDCIDYAETPGYFSSVPVAVLIDDELCFFADSQDHGADGTVYSVLEAEEREAWQSPPWSGEKFSRVIFNYTFWRYQPTQCCNWFADATELTEIERLQYLDVSEAVNLVSMFQNCTGLRMLDLSSFDTKNVRYFSSMFSGCKNLEAIYASDKFIVDAEATGWDMFKGCLSLVGGNGTAYATALQTELSYARADKPGSPGYFSPPDPQPKAVLSGDRKTLTFVYDSQDHGTENVDWFACDDYSGFVDLAPGNAPWKEFRSAVTKVVFEPSFVHFKPRDCSSWFHGFVSLARIEGLEHLDTSHVWYMDYMFYGCSSLTSLDLSSFDTSSVRKMRAMFGCCDTLENLNLSSFDTSSVEDMGYLFDQCRALASLDLSHFDTSKVTLMDGMFWFCNSLTTLDVSSFDTSKVTLMSIMFEGCRSLTDLDLSGFDTSKVTTMRKMFQDCISLTTLDLSGFDTAKVAEMDRMFRGCTNLRRIYASDGFVTEQVNSSESMFDNCTKLASDKGWKGSSLDVADARLDGGEGSGARGLFSPVVRAVLEDDGKTLRFVYGVTEVSGVKGTDWFDVYEAEMIEDPDYEDPPWVGCGSTVTKVVFDDSFAAYRPSQVSCWFYNFKKLTTIAGIGNLDVSKATSSAYLFMNCEKVESLDLSLFDTSSVTNMSGMFRGCPALKSIAASEKFVTEQVTSDIGMFYGCTSLVGPSGTTLSKTDKTYARHDFGPSRPGYFLYHAPLEARVVVEDAGWSLRFVYDAKYHGKKNLNWFSVAEAGASADDIPWKSYRDRIELVKVVFDPSFKDYRPTSCAYWFYGFNNLTTIEGFENLDTSAVVDMQSMFESCGKLPELDLRDFDTSSVTNMQRMFAFCSSLTSLDVTRFDTSKVRNMNDMFGVCFKLTSLDVSSFDTSQVEDMTYMFSQCAGLSSLDITHFDTSHVTRMGGMFRMCTQLTALDLSSFNTANVTKMGEMFSYCETLRTILVSDMFVTDNVAASSRMFEACTQLVGENGTAYADANPQDVTYARVDGKGGLPGYFTASSPSGKTPKAVVVDGGATLRFVYDAADYGVRGVDWYWVIDAETVNPNGSGDIPWGSRWTTVTKVVFDPTFRSYRPRQCAGWFHNLQKLVTIEGIRNLDTSAVTSFADMFGNCFQLTGIDVLGFNTAKATRMDYMFYGCRSLTSIDLRNFNTAKVTEMGSMFSGCTSLKALDLRGFDTAKVIDMRYMFSGCSSLKAIAASEKFVTTGTFYTESMFSGCTALKGGKGTVFDSSKVDKTYARIDGGESAPGYFSKTLVPTLFDSFAPGAINPKGATYNGFLGEESLGGTFTLAVKKPKNGTSAATLTKIDPATGKKVKVKGTVNAATGVCGGALAGLQLNAKGVGGSLGGLPAQGAVDGAKAKDAAAIAVMNGFDKRAYGLVFADAAGERAYLTATFSKKGKVKVAETFRGAKVSGKAQLCVGDTVCAVPFVWSKKGVRVSFVLWFDKAKRALVDVSGLGAGAELVDAGSAAAPAGGAYLAMMTEDAVLASVPAAIAQTPLVTRAVFNGKKFDAGKAAKVAYKKGVLTVDTSKGDNVTGLKLAYSKGALKGSFTVYAVTGGKLVKNKFKVAGVLIDGVGYAAGTNKKLPSIPLALAK